MSQIVTSIDLPLLRFGNGKVRETFDLGDHLLIVTTDRISAFDFVLPNGIPNKGEVLNRLSAFWFIETHALIPNHLITINPDDLPPEVRDQREVLTGRSMIARKAKRIDFECVVRGYLAGSGWKDYQETGVVCGIRLPEGLRQADRLPEPIFTPATKAESGHDINCTLDDVANVVGVDLAQTLADVSIALYQYAADVAIDRGIIIADTKFEFGLLDDQLIVIDEMLTPDSSRFWAAGDYAPGGSPPSFDKQFVRDWLESSGWKKQPPAPKLPPDVVDGTSRRYIEAFEWLTDEPFVPMAER